MRWMSFWEIMASFPEVSRPAARPIGVAGFSTPPAGVAHVVTEEVGDRDRSGAPRCGGHAVGPGRPAPAGRLPYRRTGSGGPPARSREVFMTALRLSRKL